MSLFTRIRFYVGEYYDALAQYDFHQPPKPWSEFFQKFSFPKPSSLLRRLAINAEYFSPNYLRLFLLIIILYAVMHPGTLLVLLLLLGLWYVALWNNRRAWSLSSIGYPQRKISARLRFFFLSGFTLVVIGWSSLFLSLFIYLGVTCLFILLHASFRNVTFRAKWNELRLQVMDAW
ncbi:hypothetical protein GpartN1_g827.t1 [Galdieria partita]|uniref:PRA1 family protein n=1 Tax=Galdieria partita TaxID=83374 RepID=A0A9C7PRF0_9RHOD|nr:hypothetical protein GpartN1_g827.t1 [Galdieria partita]